MEEECKINFFKPDAYSDFTPSQLASLVWAGLLHEKKPMTRDQVVALMPMAGNRYTEICIKVAEAIRTRLGCYGAAVADVNDLKRAAVLGVR